MKIYAKYVSAQRFGENMINEKMKSSSEFFNIITVTRSVFLLLRKRA
jgi:hypothetical protein